MNESKDLRAFLTPDAPAWLGEIIDCLTPRESDGTLVLSVMELSPASTEAFESELQSEIATPDQAEVAPVVLPIALRIATNPAVSSGIRTGVGWVLRGGAAAAGASGWKKISDWF